MPYGPAQVIPAPPLSPPAFGLLAAATVVDHDDERFLNGLTFSPENCEDVEIVNVVCGPGTEKPTGLNREGWEEYDPFVLIGRDSCSTFGFQQADYEARARRHLAAGESGGIEAELWTGALIGTNPALAAAASTSLGAGLARREGLAALVQGLADRNVGRGMIHARPYLVELWGAANLLRVEQNRLVTWSGHTVVAGSGYPGTGPAGEAIAAGVEWAFATDAVVVHRGPLRTYPDTIQQATDKVNNRVEFRAERGYAPIRGVCAHVHVSVDTTTP